MKPGGGSGAAAPDASEARAQAVLAVLEHYRTAELSTLARDGTPISWPVVAFYDEREREFLITTSIALEQKMLNARRNPHVSLLFSDPTGSGLRDAGAVLVQGDASAPDELRTSLAGVEPLLERIFERQPASALFTRTPLMRWLFDWYYMRLIMRVRPTRWFEMPASPRGAPPRPIEAPYAGS